MTDDELLDGLTALGLAVEALKQWESRPWDVVQKSAEAVGPLLREQLIGRGLWDGLEPHDHAAVYWLMAEGHSVSGVKEKWLDGHREGRRIQSLHEAADHYGALCGAVWRPRSYGREGQIRSAVDFVNRFTALPDGWREEAMRRAMAGQDIASAVADAARLRNVLKSVYGIDAWKNDGDQS
ncbi:hypothetical protein AB0H77_03795 [Streptomyces sp. NPDC050844]|uniref:hypothetical protein n=1 Tax=Streptomyces sp. NPDC050844 TaxID=3155790 RepID=UPI0033EA4046